MRALAMPRLRAATLALLALACAAPSADRDAPPAERPAAAPAAWYDRARALDLTGDGRADSVRLEARGTRPDSLDVILTLVVAGVERHREAWGSSYELALVDSAVRAGPAAAGVLRARLDSVLASAVVRRLDAPAVRLMAEDSAVLADLVPRPTRLVTFDYGYESRTRLVWDAPRERFVRLWSCC